MTISTPPHAATYGLTPPTLDDVRAAVLRTFDEPTWDRLLHTAGITAGDPGGDPGEVVQWVVAVMCADTDRLLALHGRSQRVRLRAYAHVAAGHDRLTA